MAYRQFKTRVRKTLSSAHIGPESLEDAVVDYIVRNLDLYDVQTSVNVGLTMVAHSYTFLWLIMPALKYILFIIYIFFLL